MDLLREANVEAEDEKELLKKIWVKKGSARATYEIRDKDYKPPEYTTVLGTKMEVRK
jgi:hypothetical protein|tara:strand:- start:115 stop:285 length:171 start_codon:yes stop_codon:yes gene_type:complete